MDAQVIHRGDALAKSIGSDTKCRVNVRIAHPIENGDSIRVRLRLARVDLSEVTIRRYLKKIKRSDSCWLWTGTKERHGYGQVYIGSRADGRKIRHYAHRVAYALRHGAVPADLDVMHSCDNPSCVNPNHLTLGTHQQNIADREAKGRGRKESPRIRKISVEGVREIRESNQPSAYFARKWNVCVSHINRIRRGDKRKVS